jgi:hypothetical protein
MIIYSILLFFLLNNHIFAITNHVKITHDSISTTCWFYNVSENCITSLLFSPDSQFTEYNCELGFSFTGKYKIVHDSLFLFYDSVGKGDSSYPKTLRKMYLFNGNLATVYSKEGKKKPIIIKTPIFYYTRDRSGKSCRK